MYKCNLQHLSHGLTELLSADPPPPFEGRKTSNCGFLLVGLAGILGLAFKFFSVFFDEFSFLLGNVN